MAKGTSEAERVADVIRTIVVGGFLVERVIQQPLHIEVDAHRFDMFGRRIPYMFVVSDKALSPRALEGLKRIAGNAKRVLVCTSKTKSSTEIAWKDFCNALGGAVPSWRALNSDFRNILMTTSANKKLPELKGEAWLIFEETICDGLEYLLGLRVGRYGGRTRGKKVSDLIATLPEQKLLIVDAKATKGSFDASGGGLRALVEYVGVQKARQTGDMPLVGALVVSRAFKQGEIALAKIASQFQADTQVPVTFCTAHVLADIVDRLSKDPGSRIAVRWTRVFCGGGLITSRVALNEIEAAITQRVSRK